MCLHGPDTMKSGLVFQGQKETKLLRFKLFFRSRMNHGRDFPCRRVTIDYWSIPLHSNVRCAMLKSSSPALMHIHYDQGSDI